ncbi:MAG: biotin synthase BioB [Deltaproteobacteria bacterium]|nr:biotin synthase BioB [Deltaproteobacteria bacterium]
MATDPTTSPEGITASEARSLLDAEGQAFEALLAHARAVRERNKGDEIRFCSISNAKSGRCGERCSFCAQSAHFDTDAPVYPLKTAAVLLEEAKRAEAEGAGEFSIVTSGTKLASEREFREVEDALRAIAEHTSLLRCASLGLMDEASLVRLKDAGLQSFHHNLETAKSFHAGVVPSHSFDDEVRAVQAAKAAGLHVCCGGIFGMGESLDQRVELLEQLRDLDVDTVPLNFLNPLPGTPLEGKRELSPEDCLRVVAVARLMMPKADIFVCGGREANLQHLQHRMFDAGANGTMVGNYLTTPGRGAIKDRELLDELGLRAVGATASAHAGERLRAVRAARPLDRAEHAHRHHREPAVARASLRVLEGPDA